MSGSGDRRGSGPPGSDNAWETAGKKSKKPGQAAGRQWAPRSGSTNAPPNTARPAWGSNGSSRPSGTSWAQRSDHGAAHRGNPRPPPQMQALAPRPVVTPPLANGWQWKSRSHPSCSEVEKDDAPPSGYDPEVENVNGNDTSDDGDDDMSDDMSDDYDSDASEKSFESRKANKWFKSFFEDLGTLINEQTRQLHCPACQNGPGAIFWYKGLQPLITHARTKGSARVKLHRELAALLEEELSRRGTSVVPAGEQFGKWNGLRESTDREIVWPPMVIVRNTWLEKDDNDKWKGMGNEELLDYFGEYAATRARHAYGPFGHRGMSVLIFESSAVGYMEAERLHRHFVTQGTDRNAWEVRRVRFVPGGKRQLYGFLANKEDMESFNKHCQGKSCLKYEMRSYNEMVVIQMKQMSEDNQQLNYLKNKVVKTEQRSKAVEETLGVVTQKLRETVPRTTILRSLHPRRARPPWPPCTRRAPHHRRRSRWSRGPWPTIWKQTTATARAWRSRARTRTARRRPATPRAPPSPAAAAGAATTTRRRRRWTTTGAAAASREARERRRKGASRRRAGAASGGSSWRWAGPAARRRSLSQRLRRRRTRTPSARRSGRRRTASSGRTASRPGTHERNLLSRRPPDGWIELMLTHRDHTS